MISDLNKKVSCIKTRNDFVDFLDLFYKDLKNNNNEWENKNLDDFLEALIAYSIDIEGYYKNIKKKNFPDNPTWQIFAELLMGARIYE